MKKIFKLFLLFLLLLPIACDNPLQDIIQAALKADLPQEIKITQNWTEISNDEDFDFGDVGHTWTEVKTFTIENIGALDLILSGSPRIDLVPPGTDFTITQQPESPVFGGESTSFDLSLTPSEVKDDYTVTIEIENNDTDEATFTFTVFARAFDTTKPFNVDVLSPLGGNYVKGSVTIEASAEDDVGIDKVEFFIDGAKIGEDTTPDSFDRFSISWDTTNYSDGSHDISMAAWDDDGNSTTDDDTAVTVDNTPPSNANITSPANGSVVGGSVEIICTASDALGIQKIEFFINNILEYTDTTSPYQYSWTAPNTGSYDIKIVAYDRAGSTNTDDDTTVTYDKTAPSLSSISPFNDTVFVSQSVAVNGSVSDALSDVDKVEVRYSGGSWETASGNPNWSKILTVPWGDQIIQIRASDEWGNVSSTINRSVTVLGAPLGIESTNYFTSTDHPDFSLDSITINWEAVPGSVSDVKYRLYRKSSSQPPHVPYTEIFETELNPSNLTYADSDAFQRWEYNYYVIAEKNSIQSSASATVTGFRHGQYVYDSHFGDLSNLDSPTGLLASGENVYVVDNGNGLIRIFKTWGAELDTFGSFSNPKSIAKDGSSYYITDLGTNHIEKYTYSRGNYFHTDTFSSPTKIQSPWGITIYSGNLYLADFRNDIQIFDTNGTWLATWSTPVSRDIARGSDGYFYVEAGAYILKIDSSGTIVDMWDLGFNAGGDICVDSGGYVVVPINYGFSVWTADGREIQHYESNGTSDGQFTSARGVDYDSGYLYIADSPNRIQKFVLE